MATTVDDITGASLTRWLTAADLAFFPSNLPSGQVDYELLDGRLVMMVPPGDIHAGIQAEFASQLVFQAKRRGLGAVRSEVGIVLRRNPDCVVGADVAYLAAASLPPRRSPEGYLETIPDMVVEIRSKNDTLAYVEHKIADYLKAGVRLAIVVDPESKSATLYRPNQPVVALAETDELTCEDIIPDFRLPLASLFADLPPAAPAG
ncbi:MAG: Uma2 family endonuclease [Pirellulales bacterium]|nr:Uma2 family endonuclease [Pirellulales bacterium]